jgi:uncharacterized protein (TIGR03084 family)
MQAAKDFHEECDSIAEILRDFSETDFTRETLFKQWTISDIIKHLHLWNIAAHLSLTDTDAFQSLAVKVMTAMAAGATHQSLQNEYFSGTSDLQLYQDWRTFYPDMATEFAQADPEKRIKWMGPDMSVQSCIIARQMEHWAHAQAIFDVLGLERQNTDRLKNVAHIGVTTYSWSFKVRGLTPPLPKPYVRLTAPSGAIWEWNDPQEGNRVEGLAEDFCQVVTQCRNIGDTQIKTIGATAKHWMDIAQCFAGGAEEPPAKGTRYRA